MRGPEHIIKHLDIATFSGPSRMVNAELQATAGICKELSDQLLRE